MLDIEPIRVCTECGKGFFGRKDALVCSQDCRRKRNIRLHRTKIAGRKGEALEKWEEKVSVFGPKNEDSTCVFVHTSSNAGYWRIK